MNMKRNDSGESLSDVYSLIKSPEIRDFLRKEADFGTAEKREIILHSYIPVQQKLAMLKQLSDTCSEEETRQLDEIHRVLSEYTDQIYHPTIRTIFILVEQWPYLDMEEGIWMREEGRFVDAYDNVDEIIGVLELYSQKGEGTQLYGHIEVIQVPQDAKLRNPFSFTLFWMGGKWQIKDIDIHTGEALLIEGISEDTIHLLSINGDFRHPLPFESGSRLKLQMPFMEEPFYGILWREKDGDGCWYHFLYNENIPEEDWTSRDFIDISYEEVGLCSGYSSLDWIERA